VGGGIIFATTYFPVLSPLPVSLNAQALAMFAFVRSMAQIWGISFGATMLTNELSRTLPEQFVGVAAKGIDHVFAFIPEIPGMPQPLKAQVQHAFGESVRPIWYLMTGMCGLGLVASLFMRGIPLHDYTDEQWAMGGAAAAGAAGAARDWDAEAKGEKSPAPPFPVLGARPSTASWSTLGLYEEQANMRGVAGGAVGMAAEGEKEKGRESAAPLLRDVRLRPSDASSSTVGILEVVRDGSTQQKV